MPLNREDRHFLPRKLQKCNKKLRDLRQKKFTTEKPTAQFNTTIVF